METLFCIAETMSEADVDPMFGVETQSTDGSVLLNSSSLLEQMKLWLWRVYSRIPELLSTGREQEHYGETRPETYEGFAELLGRDDIKKRTTVLTTNYDLLLEYYCWAVSPSSPCSYPLKPGWDYETLHAGSPTRNPYVNTKRLMDPIRAEEDTLLVCKLHGSVNYFELTGRSNGQFGICDDIAGFGQVIGKSAVPVYAPRHESRIKAGYRNMRPAILALDAVWNLRERYGNSLVPAIIPPTYAKLQAQPWLRQIWSCAFRAIQRARKLVFIGYSMPPSDGFMRAMFQGALAARTDSPEVFVINPFGAPNGDRDREGYETLFPQLAGNANRIIRKTFHTAWTDGDVQRILAPQSSPQMVVPMPDLGGETGGSATASVVDPEPTP